MDISIIIPIKNGEKYLKECLDSVLNQSFNGTYEVIVGVDPSEDKTLEIAQEYQKNHPNIIVESRQGKGVQTNRMDSIAKAKGKYICFLDGDDYYSKDYLKIMFEEIKKGYDIVNCSFKIDRQGKIKNNFFTKNKQVDSVKACTALLKDSYMRSFLWSKIFKRELFNQKLPLFKARDALFEDTMLVYFLFMNANKIKTIKKPLYVYRDNSLSVTKTPQKNRFEYHLYVFSYIRYLCDLNENIGYLHGFIKTFNRSKLSLWYDGHVSKTILGNSGLKELKKHKQVLKDLKNKEKMNFDKYPLIKQFIQNSID